MRSDSMSARKDQPMPVSPAIFSSLATQLSRTEAVQEEDCGRVLALGRDAKRFERGGGHGDLWSVPTTQRQSPDDQERSDRGHGALQASSQAPRHRQCFETVRRRSQTRWQRTATTAGPTRERRIRSLRAPQRVCLERHARARHGAACGLHRCGSRGRCRRLDLPGSVNGGIAIARSDRCPYMRTVGGTAALGQAGADASGRHGCAAV